MLARAMGALRAISTGTRRRCLHHCWAASVGILATLLTLCLPVSALARPGDLDHSFGEDGYALVQTNKSCLRGCVEFGGSYATALAQQPDGGLVLGGYNAYIGAPHVVEPTPGAIVRLTPNGKLDTTFGVGGIDGTPFAVNEIFTNIHGGLRVVGEAAMGRLASQRYTADGLLDGTYGSHGLKLGPAIAGRRDARGRYLDFVRLRVPPTFSEPSTTRLDVTRLLPSGARDMHFGHRGYVQLLGSKGDFPIALAAEPNGGTVAVFEKGWIDSPPSFSQLFLEHITPTGKVDRDFGRSGIASMRLKGTAGAALITMHHGHILLALGERRATQVLTFEGEEDLVLADYTNRGQLARRFGVGGIARSKFPSAARDRGISPRATVFDAAGDLIIAGKRQVHTIDTPAGDGFIARYTPQGRDCSFGTRGLIVDEGIGAADAVVVQRDGQIVIAGWGRRKRFLAARYMGGGRPRTCAG